jgi:ATP-dependent Clp protease ATP-binding subunit ClpX
MRDLARSVVAKTRSSVGHPKLTCSFCGRDETQVSRLVGGSSAHMCDGCIVECTAVLERQDDRQKAFGFDSPAPTQSN